MASWIYWLVQQQTICVSKIQIYLRALDMNNYILQHFLLVLSGSMVFQGSSVPEKFNINVLYLNVGL